MDENGNGCWICFMDGGYFGNEGALMGFKEDLEGWKNGFLVKKGMKMVEMGIQPRTCCWYGVAPATGPMAPATRPIPGPCGFGSSFWAFLHLCLPGGLNSVFFFFSRLEACIFFVKTKMKIFLSYIFFFSLHDKKIK